MNWFTSWLKRRGSWREITRTGAQYLERYFILKLFGRSVYLHQFWDSDEDFAVHDHPWFNVSIVLRGGYREWYADGTFEDRKPGSIVFRQSKLAHRIELTDDQKGKVWSLFLTGFRRRLWGFYMPEGWTEAGTITEVSGKDFYLKGWLFPIVVWLNKEKA